MNQRNYERYFSLFSQEAAEPERCLWMSFCDPYKPEGQQFLGVIVTYASGLLHAHMKINALGINPGGEIRCVETDPKMIKPEHFDKLLSKQDMIDAGYIDG